MLGADISGCYFVTIDFLISWPMSCIVLAYGCISNYLLTAWGWSRCSQSTTKMLLWKTEKTIILKLLNLHLVAILSKVKASSRSALQWCSINSSSSLDDWMLSSKMCCFLIFMNIKSGEGRNSIFFNQEDLILSHMHVLW